MAAIGTDGTNVEVAIHVTGFMPRFLKGRSIQRHPVGKFRVICIQGVFSAFSRTFFLRLPKR